MHCRLQVGIRPGQQTSITLLGGGGVTLCDSVGGGGVRNGKKR